MKITINKKKTKRVPVVIRFDEELHGKLTKIAQTKEVSVNELVCSCLRAVIENLDLTVKR